MTYRVHVDDCLVVLDSLPAESVHAIVTDPPYLLGFMSAEWDAADGIAGDPDVWRACLRVLVPGGYVLAFGATRTVHRMTTALETAGFDIRDTIQWLYGSGFPKSLDVSKALDKRRHDRADVLRVTGWVRDARDAAGIGNAAIDAAFGFAGMAGHWTTAASQPAVPTLEQVPVLLEVLGLTLDDVPADIRTLLWDLNGRKGQPGDAWNRREVLGTAVGGIVPDPDRERRTVGGHTREYLVTAPESDEARRWAGWGTALKPAHEPIVVARKRLAGTVADNVTAYGTGALNIDGCRIDPGSAVPGGGGWTGEHRHPGWAREAHRNGYAVEPHDLGRWPANLVVDEWIADTYPEWAPFFYCPKATAAERTAGGTVTNSHPTVKPVELMRWLVRLVTPPGGTVLDPFTGSGTTGVAAVLESFDFIGCELDPEHAATAVGRLEWAERVRNLPGGYSRPVSVSVVPGQLSFTFDDEEEPG